jgi:Flp pilus assembly secretin CpaC
MQQRSLEAAIESVRLATKTLEAIRHEREAAAKTKGASIRACNLIGRKELSRQIIELQNAAARLQPPPDDQIIIQVRVLEVTGQSLAELKRQMLLPNGQPASQTLTKAKVTELTQRLKAAGGLKVLAQPTLTTAIGRPANMLSGGEFPVLIPTQKGEVKIEWHEFGSRCSVVATPAEEAGKFQLDIQAGVSQKDFNNAVTQAEGLVVPGMSSHSVNTQLTLGDDEAQFVGTLYSKHEGERAAAKVAPEESAITFLVTLNRGERSAN